MLKGGLPCSKCSLLPLPQIQAKVSAMNNRNLQQDQAALHLESLIPDISRIYHSGQPYDAGSCAAHRLLADGDLTRDARAVLLKKHIRCAMVLACQFSIDGDEFDYSRVDEVDAVAHLLLEALDALRYRIGPMAASEALKAIASRMSSDELSNDVLNIVDNVRHGYLPFGER